MAARYAQIRPKGSMTCARGFRFVAERPRSLSKADEIKRKPRYSRGQRVLGHRCVRHLLLDHQPGTGDQDSGLPPRKVRCLAIKTPGERRVAIGEYNRKSVNHIV